VIGNILDGEKDCLCPEADAVGELSAHDNALSPDGREWFPLDAQVVVLVLRAECLQVRRIVAQIEDLARIAQDEVCRYSRATRGNIEVSVRVVAD